MPTRYAPEFFVKAGEVTGLSPERMKYSLSQYFSSGNIYTSLTGYAWNRATGALPEEQKNLVSEELILKKPFVRRIANKTDPYNKY